MSVLIASNEQQLPDFRVKREEASHWTISPLTPRAAHWMRANFGQGDPKEDQIIKTNLIGANALIRKARSFGFVTEYVGPVTTFHF
ncbi:MULTISPECIES: hypothetical protein [Rhizobium]|uniref:hypothetical protein n=1 Tax=Rhizobium TaxID=379 RepID=UPI001B3372D8|nr:MULTISPECIES: hypothetical protein [Rhizobium]MBX4908808.1 hypothetical protein [Rhizobium bangladeshense]MBX5215943.1 hypothetical protein [Rhizobium sp. NLR9a]MBX5222853.1 hypothetical protein [Rhizobium sp. NLR8a]MBX5227323.1 hypothetical protein [Rhizobium sp. NLR9b]MBX5234320.1 hypothetical protein [Rhizobium sp. NLR4a]